MKILNTEKTQPEFFKSQGQKFSRTFKKKKRSDEFKKILEKSLGDQFEGDEEFRILLPKHGHFWDNGYVDLE
jgi:hypothetical protein